MQQYFRIFRTIKSIEIALKIYNSYIIKVIYNNNDLKNFGNNF